MGPAAADAAAEAAAEGAAAEAAAEGAATDAAADGAAADGLGVELPEHAEKIKTATLARAMDSPADLSSKTVPPRSMTQPPHHERSSRPAEADLRELDREPTWPGEQSWG